MSQNFTNEQIANLTQHDRIPLADGYYAVSADRILDTGEADFFEHGSIYVDGKVGNQRVEWGNGDAFNQAADRIEASAQAALEQEMRENPALAAAYDRIKATNPPATYADPADLKIWDEAAAKAVSQAHAREPFSQYRTMGDGQVNVRGDRFNDIVNLGVEHDCKAHSTLEASMLERLNRGMLDDKGSRYFVVAGNVRFSGGSGGGHAFIMTAPPGGNGDVGIIEGTEHGGQPFQITDSSFADFVTGEVIIAQDPEGKKSLYGAFSDADDVEMANLRAEHIRNGSIDTLDLYTFGTDQPSSQAYFASMASGLWNVRIEDEASSDPLINLRNSSPNAFTFLMEPEYFKNAYERFTSSNDNISHGDTIVIKDRETGFTFLITPLSTGDMEVKDITHQTIPPELTLPTFVYDNDFGRDEPYVTPAPQPAPVFVDEPEPNPAPKPDSVVISPPPAPGPVLQPESPDPVVITPPPPPPAPAPEVVVRPPPEPEPQQGVYKRLAILGNGNTVIRPPDSDITKLQKALVEAGYDIGKNRDGSPMIDGLEGPKTRAAIQAYAQANGLDAGTMSLSDLNSHLTTTNNPQSVASLRSDYDESLANRYAIAAAQIPKGTLSNGYALASVEPYMRMHSTPEPNPTELVERLSQTGPQNLTFGMGS